MLLRLKSNFLIIFCFYKWISNFQRVQWHAPLLTSNIVIQDWLTRNRNSWFFFKQETKKEGREKDLNGQSDRNSIWKMDAAVPTVRNSCEVEMSPTGFIRFQLIFFRPLQTTTDDDFITIRVVVAVVDISGCTEQIVRWQWWRREN